MNRLLISAAGAALLGLGTTPALADSMTAPNFVGSMSFNAAWSDVDYDSPGFSDDVLRLGLNAAMAGSIGNNWWLQGEGSFNTVQFDSSGFDGAVDLVTFGGAAVYRGDRWSFAFNGAYDAVNALGRLDGFDIGLHGELYGSDRFTAGVDVNYLELETSGYDGDGVGVRGFGKFYFRPNAALMASVSWFDFREDGGIADLEELDIGADFEWLCEPWGASIVGGVHWTDLEDKTLSVDGDAWTVQVALKFHLGTQGNLADRDRSGTYDTRGALANVRSFLF